MKGKNNSGKSQYLNATLDDLLDMEMKNCRSNNPIKYRRWEWDRKLIIAFCVTINVIRLLPLMEGFKSFISKLAFWLQMFTKLLYIDDNTIGQTVH